MALEPRDPTDSSTLEAAGALLPMPDAVSLCPLANFSDSNFADGAVYITGWKKSPLFKEVNQFFTMVNPTICHVHPCSIAMVISNFEITMFNGHR